MYVWRVCMSRRTSKNALESLIPPTTAQHSTAQQQATSLKLPCPHPWDPIYGARRNSYLLVAQPPPQTLSNSVVSGHTVVPVLSSGPSAS